MSFTSTSEMKFQGSKLEYILFSIWVCFMFETPVTLFNAILQTTDRGRWEPAPPNSQTELFLSLWPISSRSSLFLSNLVTASKENIQTFIYIIEK